MRALIVAVALFASPSFARACADCMDSRALVAGVDDEGRLAVLSEESPGESDASSIRSLLVTKGSTVLCRAEVTVEDGIWVSTYGDAACDAWLGLDARERSRTSDRDQADPPPRVFRPKHLDPVAAVRARFTPLTQVVSPERLTVEPAANADGYRGGETTELPVLVDGVQVAHVNAGASRWAVFTYTHPRLDGLLFRVVTLLPSADTRSGSASGCTDYLDGYVAVPRARLEAAHAIAEGRRAPDRAQALQWARRAVEADPSWQPARDELRRRQRHAPGRSATASP